MLASVVIPTKNGITYIDEVLRAVFGQELQGDFEVVIVDSGSTDGTLEVISRYPAQVIRIPPMDFNHGETRNFAIGHTKGQFIALLTQDATPASPRWLASLLEGFVDDEVAGVFGPHLVRQDCDPVEGRALGRHFDNFGPGLTRHKPESTEQYRAQQGFYDFFSNCNSCIRRSVWERIPFRKTQMAEDQMWMQDVLATGHARVYQPAAPVYHSHAYAPWTYLRRTFDEFKSYEELGNPGIVHHWRQVFPSAFKEVVKELPFIARHPELSAAQRVRWLAIWPWIHLARKLGSLLGSKHRRLGPTLVRWLSLQEANRRKGARA